MHGWAVLRYVTTSVLLSGCTVGPEFQTPPPPEVTSLSPTPVSLAGRGGVEQQAYVQGLDIPRRWWELFHCDPLNSVVARAIDRNPDLAAAQAALRIANANTQAARGGYYPQVGAEHRLFIAETKRSPNAANRNRYFTLHNCNGAAVGLVCPRCLRAQQAPRRVTCGTSRSAAFRSRGSLSHLDVKARPGGDRGGLDPRREKSAEASIAVANDVLAVLRKTSRSQRGDARRYLRTGGHSQPVPAGISIAAEAPRNQSGPDSRPNGWLGWRRTKGKVRVRLPSYASRPTAELACVSPFVRERPDMRAAEANMHAATAEIGVAIANRFPQFNLTANAGASAIAKLAGASPPFLFWTLAGSAAQTLFDGMSTEQKQRAAESEFLSAQQHSIEAPSSQRFKMWPMSFRRSKPIANCSSRRIAAPRRRKSTWI